MIHNTAIVDPSAVIHETASIGPYTVIGREVTIGEHTVIGPHVVIDGPTTIGANNQFFQFASIGADPQDKKYYGEDNSLLTIGDNNVFREFVSIHRGTEEGGGLTKIGHGNHLMAYVHVAHDCIIHDNTIFSNNASIAGHVEVKSQAILAGFVGVHQFCTVGEYSFCAAGSVVLKDVPPYLMVQGYPASPQGLNRVGLKRKGFTSEQLNILKDVYKLFYRSQMTTTEAIQAIIEQYPDEPNVRLFVSFINHAKRGVVR